MLENILKEMRIKQYTKNLLVFAAPIFGGIFLQLDIMIATIATFIVFSLLSSAVYVINDIVDLSKDRQHPVKCLRPIASGAIGLGMAKGLAIVLIILSLSISIFISKLLTLFLIAYFSMNVLYSCKLKHLVIFDVMIIAVGFVIRALAGALSSGIVASSWFVLCVFMLSLFLALAKRRAEMVLFLDNKKKTRKVLDYYSLELLDNLLMVATAMSITSYAVFALQSDDCNTFINPMLLTVPLVVYGMFRYMYIVHMLGKGGEPEEILMNDKYILGTCLIYALCILIIRDF